MTAPLRPLRSGDLEAQAVVRLSLRLKRAAEADAERLGITTSEWWRRAARAALGADEAAEPLDRDALETLGRKYGVEP